MSLELVNTLASLVTATVIGATAIAAIVQLRHMRMGNQITALLSLQNEFDSKDFRDAEDVIRKERRRACTKIPNSANFASR